MPFSSPDGTGMQWDELVLAAVAGVSAWSILRLTRGMDAGYARAWRIVGVGAGLFMISQLLAGSFPGPEFDGFGPDDVVLFLGACSPLVTCAMLARRVVRTRWPALIVDGAAITVALFVVADVLLGHPVHSASAPADPHDLVLTLAGYAAVVLGGTGALCTVSTRALRRAASTLIWANTWMAAGAACEALAIAAPNPLWTAGSAVSVLLALQSLLLATGRAPRRVEPGDLRAAAPRVAAGGMAILVIAMFGLPLTLLLAVWHGHEMHADVVGGCAVVLGLLAIRVVLRIREDGRITEDLVRNEQDFRDLVESSSDGVAIVDDDLRLLFTSPAARNLLGMTDGARDCSLLDLVEPQDRALLRAALERGSGPELHFRVPRPCGTPGELEATSSERPGSGRHVLYLRDVTSRRVRERELERMAYTDHLTALPNRAHLFQVMAEDAADGARSLLVLDLDGFKAVNDVAGHEAGDQLLVDVARRLHAVVRDDDLVARLGGDEFAVLVTGTPGEAAELAQRVVDTLATPHRVGDWTFAVGASAGVARLAAGGGQLAFREADAALRAAKQAGKGCVRVAEDDVASAVASESELVAALTDGSVQLRFSAACEAGGRIGLLHAVPVWEHPVHGRVGGLDLWRTAERHGRSADLQRWLLHRACADLAALPGERTTVVVSLPAGHVTVQGLAPEVAEALATSGLPPSRLALSLTEETLLTSAPALIGELETARSTGVRLCLDNYGMGHSLFALLARLPLDLVRIDLATIAPPDDSDRALRVLASIARSTADFDLTSIAGVPTPELRKSALAAGVDLVRAPGDPHDLPVAAIAELLAHTETVPAG